jgi:hypothetical protein
MRYFDSINFRVGGIDVGVNEIEYADVIHYTIVTFNATDSNSTPWSAWYRC